MKNVRVIALVAACGMAMAVALAANASGQQAGDITAASEPSRGPQTITLTLDEAVRLAEGLAPRLGEFRARVDLATAGLQDARSGRKPDLSAFAGYSRWNNVPPWTIVQDGVPMVVFPNLPNNVLFELRGSVPLYTGGRAEANIAAAERTITASNYDVDAESANIKLWVTSIYWEMVLAIEQS